MLPTEVLGPRRTTAMHWQIQQDGPRGDYLLRRTETLEVGRSRSGARSRQRPTRARGAPLRSHSERVSLGWPGFCAAAGRARAGEDRRTSRFSQCGDSCSRATSPKETRLTRGKGPSGDHHPATNTPPETLPGLPRDRDAMRRGRDLSGRYVVGKPPARRTRGFGKATGAGSFLPRFR